MVRLWDKSLSSAAFTETEFMTEEKVYPDVFLVGTSTKSFRYRHQVPRAWLEGTYATEQFKSGVVGDVCPGYCAMFLSITISDTEV